MIWLPNGAPHCAKVSFPTGAMERVGQKHCLYNWAECSKEYFYVKPRKETGMDSAPLVENEDGFYSGLPTMNRKGCRMLRMEKIERKQM